MGNKYIRERPLEEIVDKIMLPPPEEEEEEKKEDAEQVVANESQPSVLEKAKDSKGMPPPKDKKGS